MLYKLGFTDDLIYTQGANFFTQVKTVTTSWDYDNSPTKLSMNMPTPGKA